MYKNIIKRCLDLLFAIMLFPFFLIVFMILIVLIKLEDRGPIFYNSNRLGKDGKVFTMYKFRTMKPNAEDIRNKDGSTFNSENDTRLTKVRKIFKENKYR